MNPVPRQRRRCGVYAWCTGHADATTLEHRGSLHVVPAHSGRELRFVLTAVRDAVPQVAVEVVMTRGGFPLEVAQLDLGEVRAAGEVLRALAVELASSDQERVLPGEERVERG